MVNYVFIFLFTFDSQGFLKLSVWLYLDSKNSETSLNHAEEAMLEGVAGDETPPLCGGVVAERRSAGQVEISDEATLEDLKTQVCQQDLIIILKPNQRI